jgi:EAL domain-containing protein (putative c-di-GMP-specific phosphodiesterase class I)
LIAAIDEWVLENACCKLLSWYGSEAPAISLAVNISPAQFIRKDLPHVIERILQRTGFPGNQLELEITESLFGLESSDIGKVFEQLVDLQVNIAVDDFGTAYSSLSRLKELPLHTLKIDKSFVNDLGKNTDDEILVRTIILMAHNLKLQVIAEGVENELQYQFVKENGCDMVQGFYLGKPVPWDEIREMLQSPENYSQNV